MHKSGRPTETNGVEENGQHHRNREGGQILRPARRGRTFSSHSLRFAGSGAGPHRATVRYAIHDRDVHSKTETDLRLYVCPFLLGDTLVARLDLKSDRERRMLIVQSAFLEPNRSAREIASDVAEELKLLQTWLKLDAIEVQNRRDLAKALARACTPSRIKGKRQQGPRKV